jgi:hypothetical protein
MSIVRRAVLGVLVLVAALLALPAAEATSTCQDSSPTGAYTIRVCFTGPDDGSTVSGTVPVSATVAVVSGTSPGIRRMVFSLGGGYLLTDYSAPYSFKLRTTRWVDGSYSLTVQALLRDGNVTDDIGVSLTFTNGTTTPPVNTRTFVFPDGNPVTSDSTFTVVATGDGAGGESSETAVTDLIAAMNPNLTLYTGDVYEQGTPTEFDNWYGLNQPGNTYYGRFRDITLPVVGNHEYQGNTAPGYFDYWDNIPHYYSVNRHGWHLIALDTNSAYNQTAPGTAQYDWLAADLAANTQPCTLAFYHEPLVNVGDEGSSAYVEPFWQLFARYGVDLVINGHDHSYQRYQPLDGNGNPNPAGVTEIINGAGGHALGTLPGSDARLVASAQQFGALRLGLNSAGASYAFVNTAGVTLDAGSTRCDPSKADVTAPSAPTKLTATGTYKTRIDLSWATSTDDVGVTKYQIFRDGALLDTVRQTSSYADDSVTPGSTHTYTVRALDNAGNASPASNPASAITPTVAVLFHDGFETGDLRAWTNPGGTTSPPNAGLTVVSSNPGVGSWSARARSTDGTSGAAAWKVLAQPEPELYYSAEFKVLSHDTPITLMRLRDGPSTSHAIVSVGLALNNWVTMRLSGGAPSSVTSTVTASPGVWHTLQLHAAVDGTSSSTDVWLDGVRITRLSVSGVDLGSQPSAKVELGDPGSPTTPKSFDMEFDEVAVDRQFIPDLIPPGAPPGLTAVAHSASSVVLGWSAAADNVGVVGYDIYRDGKRAGSVPGSARSFSDTGLAWDSVHTYVVRARDASGNVSRASPAARARTWIFGDGFESGSTIHWSANHGLKVQRTLRWTGTRSARAASSRGKGAYAIRRLPATYATVVVRAHVRVASRAHNNTDIVRLRTAAGRPLVALFYTSAGKIGYRNDLRAKVRTSGVILRTRSWHDLVLRVTVDGGRSRVTVWYDGAEVRALTRQDSLGTTGIGKLVVGESTTGRNYDYSVDDIRVTRWR